MPEIGPRIERVARALCEADGKDADKITSTGRMVTGEDRGAFTKGPEKRPTWTLYEDEARKFLAALDAAGGILGNG